MAGEEPVSVAPEGQPVPNFEKDPEVPDVG